MQSGLVAHSGSWKNPVNDGLQAFGAVQCQLRQISPEAVGVVLQPGKSGER